MPLDPEAKMLLEQLTAVVRPFDELSVEEARAAIVTLSAAAAEGETVARVENRTLPGPRGEIPVRVYTPEGRAPFPVLRSEEHTSELQSQSHISYAVFCLK